MSDLLSADVTLRVFKSVSTLPADLTSANYTVETSQQLHISNEIAEGPFVLLAGDVDKPLPSNLPFAPYDGIFFLQSDVTIRANINGQGPQIVSPAGFLTFATVNTVTLSNDQIAPGDTAPRDANITYFIARLSPTSATVPVPGTGGTILSNVRVPDANGVEKVLYVRLSGNDTTGDGSATKPFLTLTRALNEIPNILRDVRWIIDMTGMGTVQVGAGVTVPPFVSTDPMFVTPTAASFQDKTKGSVTIRSAMTNVTSIASADVTSTTVNTTTNQFTLVTNRNFTVNQLKGNIIVGSSGTAPVAYVVVSNTAGPNSSIVVAGTVVPDYPFSIVTQSTTLSCDANATCVKIDTLNAPVVFSGLAFVNPTPAVPSVTVRMASNLEINMASLTSIRVTESNVVLEASKITNTVTLADNERVTSQHSLFDTTTFGFDGANGTLAWNQCMVTGANALGTPLSSARTLTSLMLMTNTEVRQGTGDGVLVDAGTASLTAVDLNTNAGNGLTIKDNAYATLSAVHSAGGNNTGFGLQLSDGAQAMVSATVDVAGTAGQLKVGNNAAITWATFRTGGLPYNSTSAFDFSRVFEVV